MKVSSNFAIIDVEGGRHALKRQIESGSDIQVTLKGRIDAVFGADDGTSREFTIIVDSAMLEVSS